MCYFQIVYLQNNTAPYGSIIYTSASDVSLSIDAVNMLNNQVTESGGLIYFFDGSNSNISITNINITQNSGYLVTYPSLNVIALESTGTNMSVSIGNCSFLIAESVAVGMFILITSAFSPINLLLNNVSHSLLDSSSSSNTLSVIPQFGLFEGDNFVAQINNLQVINVSSNKTSLFVVHCDTLGKSSYNWSLIITQSVFSNISLNMAIFKIDSDGKIPGAQNDFSLVVQSTQFSDISWLLSVTVNNSANSSAVGGIINSLTSQIGRDSALSSTPNTYAVSLQNCTFKNFEGTGSLIFSSVESMYDGVLLVNSCTFSNISSSSATGAIFNPSHGPINRLYLSNTTIIINKHLSK